MDVLPVALDVTGSPTVGVDMPYTLDLSDPNGAITGGTVSWGDGQTSAIPSGATSLTHVYTTSGPASISASVTDSTSAVPFPVSLGSGTAGAADGSRRLAGNRQPTADRRRMERVASLGSASESAGNR